MENNKYDMLLDAINELIKKYDDLKENSFIIIEKEKSIKAKLEGEKKILSENITTKKAILKMIDKDDFNKYKTSLISVLILISAIFAVPVYNFSANLLFFLSQPNAFVIAFSALLSAITSVFFGTICYRLGTRKYRELNKVYTQEFIEKEIEDLENARRNKAEQIFECNLSIDDQQKNRALYSEQISRFTKIKEELISNIRLIIELTDGKIVEINQCFQKDSKAQNALLLVRKINDSNKDGEN